MAEADGEAGSTLLLVPSAVLVLFLLTALAVDAAAAFLAQRELADACAGAANDAAAAALDVDRLYRSGGPGTEAVDLERTGTIARSRVVPLEARWRRPVDVRTDVAGPQVTLRLEADVPLPVGPGGASGPTVHVTATCTASTIRR